MNRVVGSTLICATTAIGVALAQAADPPSGARGSATPGAVYVERLTLTDVADQAGPSLNVGAVAASSEFAAGLQKAADVWGINLDLFVETNLDRRRKLVARLIESSESTIVVEALSGEEWYPVAMEAASRNVGFTTYGPQSRPLGFQDGWNAFKAARATLLARIPKYDEILPIAFPVSPLPDNFFQSSTLSYPRPVLRVPRTEESVSAVAPFQTACAVVEQTGNMLHRGSTRDADVFMMGMEGGILSLQAALGAVEPEKLAAVATSQVIAIRGPDGGQRNVLVENDAMASSLFTPAIHAPEELEEVLTRWTAEKRIAGFARVSGDEVLLKAWNGRDRRMRAGLFLVPAESSGSAPELVSGRDVVGRTTLDFRSRGGLWQQFAEIGGGVQTIPARTSAKGGLPTVRGATVGAAGGATLRSVLVPMAKANGRPNPFVLTLEGGFFVVTPEQELGAQTLASRVRRVDMDLRGPLSSDQTITVEIDGGRRLLFRRTVLDFGQLDRGLGTLKSQGLIRDWTYEGVRGRGLSANVVLYDFLGKHRRFMSSLAATPLSELPKETVVRFYVDGMQRLNFSLATTSGWRQEFVEVPMRLPPVPRDIELYSGVSVLE